jgi:hypothetical protein
MAKAERQAWRRHAAALRRIREFGTEGLHEQLTAVVEAAGELNGLLDRLEAPQRLAVLLAAGLATAELRGMARGLKAVLDSESGATTPGEAAGVQPASEARPDSV